MTTITTEIKLFPYPKDKSEIEKIDSQKEMLEKEGYTTKSFLVTLSTFHSQQALPPEFMLIMAIK